MADVRFPEKTVVLRPEDIYLRGKSVAAVHEICCGADGDQIEAERILSEVLINGIVRVNAGWMDPVYIIDFSGYGSIEFCEAKSPELQNIARMICYDRFCPHSLFELMHSANSGEIQVHYKAKDCCYLIVSAYAYTELRLY